MSKPVPDEECASATALKPEDLAAVQQQVRRRVLRWFARASHFDAADACDIVVVPDADVTAEAFRLLLGSASCGHCFRWCGRPIADTSTPDPKETFVAHINGATTGASARPNHGMQI